MLLAKFYPTRQKEDEDVVTWSCRLEEMSRAKDQCQVEEGKMDSMLRSMFWNGQRPSLKDVTSHLYDRITDFNKLCIVHSQAF